MGFLLNLTDAILFFFFLLIAIVAPLLDSQACLPQEYYPQVLVDLSSWYSAGYGDYLVLEKPHFFVGLVWLELFLLWPLSIANLFGLASGKSWFNTACLIFGVSMSTSMVAILSELIGSGRASDKLLMMYSPFMGLAVLAVLRGCVSPSNKSAILGKRPMARKKRV